MLGKSDGGGSAPNTFPPYSATNSSMDTTQGDNVMSSNAFYRTPPGILNAAATNLVHHHYPQPHQQTCPSSAHNGKSGVVKFVNSTPDIVESQLARAAGAANKKKRCRTTDDQLRILQKAFLAKPMPDAHDRLLLAKRLGMSARAIQVWFQNRRAKEKHEHKRPGNDVNLSQQQPHSISNGGGKEDGTGPGLDCLSQPSSYMVCEGEGTSVRCLLAEPASLNTATSTCSTMPYGASSNSPEKLSNHSSLLSNHHDLAVNYGNGAAKNNNSLCHATHAPMLSYPPFPAVSAAFDASSMGHAVGGGGDGAAGFLLDNPYFLQMMLMFPTPATARTSSSPGTKNGNASSSSSSLMDDQGLMTMAFDHLAATNNTPSLAGMDGGPCGPPFVYAFPHSATHLHALHRGGDAVKQQIVDPLSLSLHNLRGEDEHLQQQSGTNGLEAPEDDMPNITNMLDGGNNAAVTSTSAYFYDPLLVSAPSPAPHQQHGNNDVSYIGNNGLHGRREDPHATENSSKSMLSPALTGSPSPVHLHPNNNSKNGGSFVEHKKFQNNSLVDDSNGFFNGGAFSPGFMSTDVDAALRAILDLDMAPFALHDSSNNYDDHSFIVCNNSVNGGSGFEAAAGNGKAGRKQSRRPVSESLF